MNDNYASQPPPPQTPGATATFAPPPPPPPVVPPVVPVVVERKSAGLAGFLSVFPGLGHLYLGLYQRAFMIGGAFILLCTLTSHGRGGTFFGLMIAFVWFFGVIDAVRQARAINRGQLAEAGFAGEQQLKMAASTKGLTWGVILVGIGGLLLANEYLDLEGFWDAMDTWGAPAAFILLGLILIVSHVMKRRLENESQIGMPPRSR